MTTVSAFVRVLKLNTSLFQGLNITTTADLQVNTFTSTVSGTATVRAANATNGQPVYTHSYTLRNVPLTNMSMTETGRFLLNIPDIPYRLSPGISLMIQGKKITVQVDVGEL